MFNEVKTVCITFSRKKVMRKINISLGGKTLRNEETVKHLGVTVHQNLCDELAVQNICGDIIWRVNGNAKSAMYSSLCNFLKL